MDLDATLEGEFLRTPGVDFGRPLQVVKLVPERGGHPEYIVTFRAGHSTWGGLGSRDHAPAEYSVWQVISRSLAKGKEHDYHVRRLVDFPSAWKKKKREDR